ncbi:acetolactate synthase small subunit [Methanobrevibacter filiformis]|uniref:Acetolactate synthase small subunit n=1 Tax=Methanobrevibacter filiformis TaxID=55758 RepID=A0A166F0I6_9EURY|nr:acetolactate synthase small subunit [Methanobrevibacter filiformis]KZX17198.1 acetolactate synthase small subunit [Methanobrevibacter filiformis]
MDSHVISTLVENRPGVLQNVASLFTRRGFNIESITVGGSETENLARMVIVVKGDEKVLEQITKQLNKLVDIIKVRELNPGKTLKRELCLIKVKADDERKRAEIIQYTNTFRGKIVDISENNITIEITGDPSKINALINLLKSFGIKKIARTGSTAIERDI